MQLGAKQNLVICQKSKVQNWIDHFKDNYPQQLHVLNLTTDSGMTAFWEYQKLNSHLPIVGVINYDLIWRRPELLNLKDFTLMLDESSLIQNETSKRSKFILKMDPKNVILLSGTPTGGKYEKLWSQMHLLGWKISKQLYWNQFVDVEYLDTLEGRSIPIVKGYKNVYRLKQKMAEYGCQFLKSNEVFDLPDQIFQKVKVPASKDYKKFHKDRIIDIEDETLVGDTTLTKMLYERKLCGLYSQDKLKAFADLVESTDDRLIVFYNFTEELNRMQDVLLKLDFHGYSQRFSVVNGEVKALQNYETKSNSITFIQYQAGAFGLNLQKASRMIFFTLPQDGYWNFPVFVFAM